MEWHPGRAAEIGGLAQSFRARAAEAEDPVYRRLMLRTAAELEDLANQLLQPAGTPRDDEFDAKS